MRPIDENDEIRVLGGTNWQQGRDDEAAVSLGKNDGRRRLNKYLRWAGILILLLLLLGGGAYFFYHEHYVYRFNYPLSRTQSEVIASLQQSQPLSKVGVETSQDSVLGVALKLYKLNGLQAALTSGVPDLKDEKIYLVTRSSDYRYQDKEKIVIGDYIVDGEELQHNAWRAGYFAVVNGEAEIGIGRRPNMRDFVLENHGSMFRQFALVSAGVQCASQFQLKGKVTRCAYARKPNNDLYFVETKYPETLYGFSDALIEYGFVDAIYITGGAQPELFYRDVNGARHGDFLDDHSHQMVVWKKR